MEKIIKITGVLFFLFIVWIIYLANTGNQSVFFDFVKSIPLGDKVGHFILFGSLTYFLTIILKFKSIVIQKIEFYYGALCVIGFVIIEEFSQNFIAHRTFDYFDLVADFVGILIASIITKLTRKNISCHIL